MANFLWGSGGAKLTPEEIALQRSLIARRKAQGVDVSPIASPLQGLARVVDALGDRYQEGQLNDAATASASENAKLLADAYASLGANPAQPVGVASLLQPSSTAQNASIPQTADAAAIRQGLIARGLPEHIADGFLVNFKDESGLNPGINEAKPLVPGSRGGFGLYQLTGPRRTAYEAYAAQKGVDPANVDAQLDWLKYELEGPEKKAAESIFATGDTASAAQAIVNNFLRPAPENRERRAASYANLAGSPVVSGGVSPIRQAATVANPQVAQAQTIAPTNSLGVSPAVLQALNSPYANDQTRGVAKLLIEKQMGQAAQQQKLALAEQQRQQEISRRQGIAQQLGVNPAYAMDDDIWKEGVKQNLAPPSTVTVGNNVYDTRNPSQPLIVGPVQQPISVQEFQYGVENPDFVARQDALRRAGAPTTEGAIPAGYQANRDSNGRIISVSPLAGSPAAFEEAQRNKSTDKQEGQRSTSTDVVTNAGVRAVQALSASGLPATGSLGRIMSNIPESNAAEIRRQVATLKANASASSIQAMREASPTGAALGGTSDKDVELLANKAGALDPDSPNFDRDVKDYVKTQLEIIHGPKAGREIYNSIDWSDKNSAPGTSAPSGKRLKFTSTGELVE